ncbi:MAG: hypothetical protein FVQ77_01390 [Cytophagales bacterium]|nr:hypothetical protein [Cytophagales bacterium]
MMRFILKIFYFLNIILILARFSSAQEMLGLTAGNYAGTNGLMLNPASMLNLEVPWEVNLFTFGLFVDNNYAYLPDASVFGFLRQLKNKGELIAEQFEEPEEFKNNLERKSAYVNLMIRGPAVMIEPIHNHKFAFYTAFRTIVSANRIHFILPKFAIGKVNDPQNYFLDFNDETFKIPKFRINAMSWSELGLSYATTIIQNPYFSINAGATIKRLYGYAGGYLLNRSLELQLIDQDIYSDINVEYGFIDPDSYDPSFSDDPSFSEYRQYMKSLKKGKGYGLDIGIVIKQMDVFKRVYYKGGSKVIRLLGEKDKINYQWRLGLSLIDVGRIKFNKDAQKYEIKSLSNTSIIKDLDILLNSKDYDFPDTNLNFAAFNMMLPTAFSMQADYKIKGKFYMNSTWVQKIVFRGPGVDRANIFSLTPRFELDWFELDLPFVLYQYRYPRFGMAVRIGFFTIGSDKIGSILIPGKFSGTDIYFSFRIKPMRKEEVPIGCSFDPY